MKKTFANVFGGFLYLAASAFIIVSCTKQTSQDFQLAESQTLRTNAALISSTCGLIPYDLEVPAGNKLALQAYAKGLQIYQVRRNAIDTNIYEWVNIAPSATLYTRADFINVVGIHYKGPTWEFSKGQFKDDKVVASKWKGVIVDTSAIPWLILKAVDSLSSTANKITYIQRVCTKGGLPPLTPATVMNVGLIDSIPYTATYLFYIKD